ncbi:MAG: hypothetical protein IJG18_01870 [Kiritimatiellae bacterium]|nr:hypothetical protein [Kiritimatiellia bacterium]
MNKILVYRGMADDELDNSSKVIIGKYKGESFVDASLRSDILGESWSGILSIGTPSEALLKIAKAQRIPLFCTGTVQTNEDIILSAGIKYYRWWISATDQTYLVARRMIGEIHRMYTSGNNDENEITVRIFYSSSQVDMQNAFKLHFETLSRELIPHIAYKYKPCAYQDTSVNTSIKSILSKGDFVYVTGYGDNYEYILKYAVSNSAVVFTDIALPILCTDMGNNEVHFPPEFKSVRYLSLVNDIDSKNLFQVFVKFSRDRIADCFSAGVFCEEPLHKGVYLLGEKDSIVLRKGGSLAPCLVGKIVNEFGYPAIDENWRAGVDNLVCRLTPIAQVNFMKDTEALVDKCAKIQVVDISDCSLRSFVWEVLRHSLLGQYFDLNHVMIFSGEKALFSDTSAEVDIFQKGLLSALEDKPIQVNLREYDLCDNDSYRLFLKCSDDSNLRKFAVPYCQSIEKRFPVVAAWSQEDAAIKFKNSSREAISKMRKRGEALTNWTKDYLKGDDRWVYLVPETSNALDKGCIVFSCKRKLDLIALQLVSNSVNRVFDGVRNAIATNKLKIANTKSAIGSIMSRNGSHNIGSHVLAALSHNIGTMPDDRVLYQYIQHRMDYTATATTDFPTWAGSAKLVNDLTRRFLSQRHLLEYIASSEGLHAFKFQDPNVSGPARWSQENTIKLHVSRRFNDGRKSVEFITYSDDPIVENASNVANAKKSVRDNDKFSSDLAVALPGGIVGSHAFFTILENVIRNAAKHGWSKFKGEKTNLDVYVDFAADDDGRAVLVDVYDGISNVFATFDDYWMVDKDLLKWFEECRDVLQRLTRDERMQISKFLSGKGAVDSLPECYKKQYLLLKNRDKDAIEKIERWLVGEASSDGGIGKRLWTSHTTDESLKRWYETYKEALQTSLLPSEQECIAEFLSGKCSVAQLPVFYQEQYACLLKYNENELKRIAGRLIGDVPGDGRLGNRLWMPLHHCQQIRIEKPFIDETGSLRRENWGLAEMKISAGYLNKRSISDIGGMSKGIPIITPIRANEDHLGYHFTIPRPRDIAFVCDTTGVNVDIIKELRTLGVFVVPPPKDGRFVKPKNDSEEDWNYSFVVLPKFPSQADPHLPFRVLANDNSGKVDMVPNASGFYDDVLKDLQNGTISAEAVAKKLKVKAIKAWITYWSETRRRFDSGLPALRVLTTEVGSSGNPGQGLVSNLDVWNFVFKEMFRSIVGNLLKDGELRPNIIADEVYWYLALIVAMPKTLDINGNVFGFVGENEILRKKINDVKADADYSERELIFKVLDGWFSVLQGILRDTPDGLLQGFAAFAEKYKLRRMAAVDNKKGLEAVYAIALKYHAKVSEALGNNASDFKIRQGNPLYQGNAVNKSNGMPMFVKDLCSAYRESDVMLRKYEERIITLPCCFGEDLNDEIKGNSGGEGVDGVDNKIVQELGISLVYNEKDAEWNEGKSIAFMRHATSDDFNQDKMLYLEPLSGTQSYLNDMMMLGQNESVYQRLTNYHLIAKMYETGLSRILIVDERVSKFLRNRSDEIKTFCRMGIWCVDETKFGEEKIGLDSLITLDKGRFDAFLRYAIVNGSSATNCEELPLRDWRFDILIIHQGLIDKWLPHVGTDCGKVESFIKRLKEFVPYVVITTGRGTPANIPDSARILPFSVVETALFKKYPEKMVLVDTIMNILPIGEHK